MRISNKNFINQLRLKNEEALEYVLDNYGWIIKATVRKHLYNLESYQEECINDILLAIWNNIDSFDESRSEFKNWLAGVAKYKAIDYKRRYLKKLEYDNIEDLNISVEDSAHKELTSKELNEDLEELLNCLKEEDRQLFIKLYVEEKDMNEVSKETGLKKDVIYNRVSRGKMKIKKLFKIVESRG
jgi:RNA polymerase sigma-70 factor (ECF subfamily)